MKFSPLAALGLVVVAAVPAGLAAQTTAETPAPAAAATAFSLDTPIEALMADERAKAVVVKHLPGIDVHPSYEQFKTMTLKFLAPYSQGMITEEKLTLIAADLAAIK
ncbi:hypothetical protein [Erythrobacter sp. BLCC-B19]|uniref:hypothetical protein n=1 Tax=Erythrobacter sp. BLCC-B19 TaxID=3025315 RepID=UPI0023622290|nr:hypothetical protein [Erythrobacter sp. BLCC-B19]WDA42328.1 hypothetical protein PS060_05820 [Erythrobacter sp. BLCC-B19]